MTRIQMQTLNSAFLFMNCSGGRTSAELFRRQHQDRRTPVTVSLLFYLIFLPPNPAEFFFCLYLLCNIRSSHKWTVRKLKKINTILCKLNRNMFYPKWSHNLVLKYLCFCWFKTCTLKKKKKKRVEDHHIKTPLTRHLKTLRCLHGLFLKCVYAYYYT